MRKIKVAVIFLLLMAVSASAKVRTDVQAGYGILPVTACKGGFRQVATAGVALSSADRADARHFQYTIDLAYNFGAAPTDFAGVPSQVKADSAGAVLLGADYVWRVYPVYLYSGAAVGAELRHQSSGRGSLNSAKVAYQLTLVGLQVPVRRFLISGELGVGHLGILRLGVGYKF